MLLFLCVLVEFRTGSRESGSNDTRSLVRLCLFLVCCFVLFCFLLFSFSLRSFVFCPPRRRHAGIFFLILFVFFRPCNIYQRVYVLLSLHSLHDIRAFRSVLQKCCLLFLLLHFFVSAFLWVLLALLGYRTRHANVSHALP